MSRVIQSSPFRYIFESAVSEVLEEVIPVFYSGHKQIFVPIIVDIRKGSTHTDLTTQAYSRTLGNIFKAAVAEIAPKFVAAHLVDEVYVIKAIPIHVSHRHTAAMIVMYRFIEPCTVIRNRVLEGDSTLL